MVSYRHNQQIQQRKHIKRLQTTVTVMSEPTNEAINNLNTERWRTVNKDRPRIREEGMEMGRVIQVVILQVLIRKQPTQIWLFRCTKSRSQKSQFLKPRNFS